MIHELLYTSHDGKGLRSGGGGGYCTVLASEGMAPNVATALERLSGYKHPFDIHDARSVDNPVNYRHVVLRIGGVTYHILSRVADLRHEHTGRSNKLAHHVAIPRNELPAAGPSQLLAAAGFCRTDWDGKVRITPAKTESELPPAGSLGGPCNHWRSAAGDAGWAGVVADHLLNEKSAPISIIYQPQTDTLALVNEVLSLLPPANRWQTTFSTYFTSLPAGTTCALRFYLTGTTEAEKLRRDYREKSIDLCSSLGTPPDSELVQAARTGKIEHAPPSSASRSRSVSAPVRSGVEVENSDLRSLREGDLTPAPPTLKRSPLGASRIAAPSQNSSRGFIIKLAIAGTAVAALFCLVMVLGVGAYVATQFSGSVATNDPNDEFEPGGVITEIIPGTAADTEPPVTPAGENGEPNHSGKNDRESEGHEPGIKRGGGVDPRWEGERRRREGERDWREDDRSWRERDRHWREGEAPKKNGDVPKNDNAPPKKDDAGSEEKSANADPPPAAASSGPKDPSKRIEIPKFLGLPELKGKSLSGSSTDESTTLLKDVFREGDEVQLSLLGCEQFLDDAGGWMEFKESTWNLTYIRTKDPSPLDIAKFVKEGNDLAFVWLTEGTGELNENERLVASALKWCALEMKVNGFALLFRFNETPLKVTTQEIWEHPAIKFHLQTAAPKLANLRLHATTSLAATSKFFSLDTPVVEKQVAAIHLKFKPPAPGPDTPNPPPIVGAKVGIQILGDADPHFEHYSLFHVPKLDPKTRTWGHEWCTLKELPTGILRAKKPPDHPIFQIMAVENSRDFLLTNPLSIAGDLTLEYTSPSKPKDVIVVPLLKFSP